MEQLVATVKATSALPVAAAYLAWRRVSGRETGTSMMQRLGMSADSRGAGPLIWFHASTTAECAVALPVLFRCLQEYNEKVGVMLTTGSLDAYNMLRASLPRRVVVQLVPLDNPVCVGLFMRKWRPTVGIMVESPFCPHLVLVAAQWGCRLALVNAHMEPRDLLAWHAHRGLRHQLSRVLQQFTLIVPQSDVDVGRFRIFGATMQQMPGWCNELKYAALMGGSLWHLWRAPDEAAQQLKGIMAGRPHWMAANTVHGEEEVVGRLHLQLAQHLPGLLTVVVPQDPGRAPQVHMLLAASMGLRVATWGPSAHANTADLLDAEVLLVDDPHQLPLLYSVCDLTLMGNSLVAGCTGHNLAQAAVAGCALLLGPHAGSCLNMAEELNNAALLAAEDAATAVRNTGALLEAEPLGWEPQEPPPSAADTTPTHHTPTDDGAAVAGRPSASSALRQRLAQRLSLEQRASGGAPAAPAPGAARPTSSGVRPRSSVRDTLGFASLTRPSTAPTHHAGHALLLSHASQWSHASEGSECDSLCSDGDLAPHHIVQCLYGPGSSAGSFSPGASCYTPRYSPGRDEAGLREGGSPLPPGAVRCRSMWSPRSSALAGHIMSGGDSCVTTPMSAISGLFTPTRLARAASLHGAQRPFSAGPSRRESLHLHRPHTAHAGVHPEGTGSLSVYGQRASSTQHVMFMPSTHYPLPPSPLAGAPGSQPGSPEGALHGDGGAERMGVPDSTAGHLALHGHARQLQLLGSRDSSRPASPEEEEEAAVQGQLHECGTQSMELMSGGGAGPMRWDRLFADAAQDPVPWSSPSPMSSTCSPGTPAPNALACRYAYSAGTTTISDGPGQQAASPQRSARVSLLCDASTQTEPAWLARLPSTNGRAAGSGAAGHNGELHGLVSTQLLVAAMLGAMSGVRATCTLTQQAPLTQDPAMSAVAQHASQAAGSPPTFTPAQLHMRLLEASLAGLAHPVARSQGGSSQGDSSTCHSPSHAAQGPAGVPPPHPFASGLAAGPISGCRAGRSPLSACSSGAVESLLAAGSPAAPPMLTRTSSPAVVMREPQPLTALRVPHSTWAATSCASDSRAASPTKPTSPSSIVHSPTFTVSTAFGSSAASSLRAAAAAAVAAGCPPDAEDAACTSPKGGWALELATPDAGAWDFCMLGRPERSGQSAPLLRRRNSFEFQFSGGVASGPLPAQGPAAGGEGGSSPSRLACGSGPMERDIVRAAVAQSHAAAFPFLHTAATAAAGAACTGPAPRGDDLLAGLELTVRAPQPTAQLAAACGQPGAVHPSSPRGSYHSDPGSPSCASQPSSGRSEREWARSDSGSPTNPALRVSVAGWMGDFGGVARSPTRTPAPGIMPPTPELLRVPELEGLAAHGSSHDDVDAPLRVASPVQPVQPAATGACVAQQSQQAALVPAASTVGAGMGAVREGACFTSTPPASPRCAALSASGTDMAGGVAIDAFPRRASLPHPSPTASVPPQLLGVTDQTSKAASAAAAAGLSRTSSLNSVSSSLRSVRTPRATLTDGEPVLTAEGLVLPPPSPRASISPRTSFSPDPIGLPPLCAPRSSTPLQDTALNTRMSASAGVDASFADLQALAASEATPAACVDGQEPETPTSRISAMQSVTSPFAGSVYDRPDPFGGAVIDRPDPFLTSPGACTRSGFSLDGQAAGVSLMLRGDSLSGHSVSGPNPFRLAINDSSCGDSCSSMQQPLPLLTDGPAQPGLVAEAAAMNEVAAEQEEPPTPTSRLSAMQSVTSPFATATFDRPNPFACSEFDHVPPGVSATDVPVAVPTSVGSSLQTGGVMEGWMAPVAAAAPVTPPQGNSLLASRSPVSGPAAQGLDAFAAAGPQLPQAAGKHAAAAAQTAGAWQPGAFASPLQVCVSPHPTVGGPLCTLVESPHSPWDPTAAAAAATGASFAGPYCPSRESTSCCAPVRAASCGGTVCTAAGSTSSSTRVGVSGSAVFAADSLQQQAGGSAGRRAGSDGGAAGLGSRRPVSRFFSQSANSERRAAAAAAVASSPGGGGSGRQRSSTALSAVPQSQELAPLGVPSQSQASAATHGSAEAAEAEPETPRLRPRESAESTSTTNAWLGGSPYRATAPQLQFDDGEAPAVGSRPADERGHGQGAAPASPASRTLGSGAVGSAHSRGPVSAPASPAQPAMAMAASESMLAAAACQVRAAAVQCADLVTGAPGGAAVADEVSSMLAAADTAARCMAGLASRLSQVEAEEQPAQPHHQLFDQVMLPAAFAGPVPGLMAPSSLSRAASAQPSASLAGMPAGSSSFSSASRTSSMPDGAPRLTRSPQLAQALAELGAALEAMRGASAAPAAAAAGAAAPASPSQQLSRALQGLWGLLGEDAVRGSGANCSPHSMASSSSLGSSQALGSTASLHELSLAVGAGGMGHALSAARAAGFFNGNSFSSSSSSGSTASFVGFTSAGSATSIPSPSLPAGTDAVVTFAAAPDDMPAAADAAATAAPGEDDAEVPRGEVGVYETDQPPEGSAPLVLPGPAGPMLVAAPSGLVSRLSRTLGAATGSEDDTPLASRASQPAPGPASPADKDGMDSLLSGLPHQLPRLRVPPTIVPGGLPATARCAARPAAPITALSIHAPATAPAAAAWISPNALMFRDVPPAAAAAAVTTAAAAPAGLRGQHSTASSQAAAGRASDGLALPLPVLTCRTSLAPRSSGPANATPAQQVGAAAATTTAPKSAAAAAAPAAAVLVHEFTRMDPSAALAAKAANQLPPACGTTSAAAAATPAPSSSNNSNSNGAVQSSSAAATAPQLATLTGSALAPGSGEQHGGWEAGGYLREQATGGGRAPADSNCLPATPHASPVTRSLAPAPTHRFVLPANQLSRTTGPAVWVVTGANPSNPSNPSLDAGPSGALEGALAAALLALLQDPLDRRSRGHAAAQAAAKLASGLVNTVWHVLDDTTITPALHGYVQAAGTGGPR